jgi:hypothetical protein
MTQFPSAAFSLYPHWQHSQRSRAIKTEPKARSACAAGLNYVFALGGSRHTPNLSMPALVKSATDARRLKIPWEISREGSSPSVRTKQHQPFLRMRRVGSMSALTPKADTKRGKQRVCFVPIADIAPAVRCSERMSVDLCTHTSDSWARGISATRAGQRGT